MIKQIGPFILQEAIAVGGSAVVYKARDIRSGELVALKHMQSNLIHRPNAYRRFLQEAEILRALDHPAILKPLDVGEFAGQPYVAMPLITGGTLRDRLSEQIFLLDEVLHILKQIAPAIDLAHKAGILHRDIKPHNILLDDDNNAYLCDFGIAHHLAEISGERTVTILGTPEYMSPEQIGEQLLSPQTDVYQLGVTIYQLLTGRLPFNGTQHEIMTQHLQSAPPDCSGCNGAIPGQIDRVLHRALAKLPARRYSTASDLLQALQDARSGTTITSQVHYAPEPAVRNREGALSATADMSPSVSQRARRSSNLITAIASLMGVVLLFTTGFVSFNYFNENSSDSGPTTILIGPEATEEPTFNDELEPEEDHAPLESGLNEVIVEPAESVEEADSTGQTASQSEGPAADTDEEVEAAVSAAPPDNIPNNRQNGANPPPRRPRPGNGQNAGGGSGGPDNRPGGDGGRNG